MSGLSSRSGTTFLGGSRAPAAPPSCRTCGRYVAAAPHSPDADLLNYVCFDAPVLPTRLWFTLFFVFCSCLYLLCPSLSADLFDRTVSDGSHTASFSNPRGLWFAPRWVDSSCVCGEVRAGWRLFR